MELLRILSICAALLMMIATLSLADKVGSEFLINTYTTGNQGGPSVAIDATGKFVVVWSSANQDGDNYGIFAQRFNFDGTKAGLEFQVNSYTTGIQSSPEVAVDASGNFVVVWQSNGQDGNLYGIYGQRYDKAGVAQGSEFRINTTTTGDQKGPAVGMDQSGNFVVVWQSDGQDGDGYGIYGQIYDLDGNTVGSEFLVNTTTTGDQIRPDVMANDTGDFVVVWQGPTNFYAQYYRMTGAKFGPERSVLWFSGTSVPDYIGPMVGLLDDESYVTAYATVWGDLRFEIYADRKYSGGDIKIHVNQYTDNDQYRPDIATDKTRYFFTVWQSQLQDGQSGGIYGRFHTNTFSPLGDEFQINTTTLGEQRSPRVAISPYDRSVVVWVDGSLDGSGSGVYGQLFDTFNIGPAVIQFSSITYEIDEYEPTAVISVTRTRSDSGTVTVNYQTANGTANSGSDYASASGMLTWAAGDTTAKTFNVQILNDNNPEYDETVLLSLSGVTGYAELGFDSSTLTIHSDDLWKSRIEYLEPVFNIGEEDTFAIITVIRTRSDTGVVTVNYGTANGTAIAGEDYETTNGTLAWAAGDTLPKTFSVPIINDAEPEPMESVILYLSSLSGYAEYGENNVATLQIRGGDWTEIPALGKLGMIVLLVGLLSLAVFIIKRRSVRNAVRIKK